MIKIEITIPDNKEEILKNTLNYQDKVLEENEKGEAEEVDNPVSLKEHTEDWLIGRLNREINRQEKREAINNVTLTRIEHERTRTDISSR